MSTLLTEEVFDNRDAFAAELIEQAARDDRVVAVCNDSVGSSKLGGFAERFPARLINVGIAEQNMVGVAAGLASSGLIPFVCAAAPFLTGRALEQIKADVAYSQHPVVLCGMSPGVAYGALGPTHHSIEDLSWLRPMTNLDIVVPADRAQTRAAVQSVVAQPRPTYIRVGRSKVPDLTIDLEWQRGKLQTILASDNDQACLIGLGSTLRPVIEAAQVLHERGVRCRVVNASQIAPLDIAGLKAIAQECAVVVTVEESSVTGGLGAAVATVIAQLDAPRGPRMRILGMDGFAPTGSENDIFEWAGLTVDNIVSSVEDAVG